MRGWLESCFNESKLRQVCIHNTEALVGVGETRWCFSGENATKTPGVLTELVMCLCREEQTKHMI